MEEEKYINSVINGITADYECSDCKHVQKVNIFPLINFNKNPEYYSLVKDLSIFKVTCEKCGHEKIIQFDSLIVDETHKYFVYLLSDKSLYNKFKYQITYFIETVLNKDDKYDLNEYKTRLVYSPNDLIEKMNIFEIGLNDQAIEIIKCAFFDKELVNRNIYDLIYFDGLNEANLEFVAISSKTTSKEPKKFVVDFNFYNKIIDDIKNINLLNPEYFKVIDEDWVRSTFKNSEK